MMFITASRIRLCRFVIITTILLSCNNQNRSNETTKDKQMETVQVAKTRQFNIQGKEGSLFVNDGGKDGIPVVLVHSFGGSSQHWEAQLDHLREKRRAIAFDLRGHGQSGNPSDDNYHVQSLSSDIEAVVDSLDIDRFVLVGHSMGGSAAIEYAMRNPEKVAGLVLVGTPGKSPASESKPIIASLESDQYDTVMDQYMHRLLASAKPEVSTIVLNGMKQVPKKASINIIKALFDYDPIPALTSYAGPTLLISTASEQQTNSLAKQLPEVPHKVIKGTSHWIHMDKPAEFNMMLDEFLSGLDKEKK
jgi:pimeloyl-ACP methyl ester carboxylesterase